jgi:hypothetical protein
MQDAQERVQSETPALMTTAPKHRPTGVTILAVLWFVTGASDAVGTLYMVFKMFSPNIGGAIVYIGLTIYLLLMASVLLAKAALFVAAGIGLFKLQNWARLLSIGFIGFGVLVFTRALLTSVDRPARSLGALIAFALGIWLIVYFFKPHVKQAFGVTGP